MADPLHDPARTVRFHPMVRCEDCRHFRVLHQNTLGVCEAGVRFSTKFLYGPGARICDKHEAVTDG